MILPFNNTLQLQLQFGHDPFTMFVLLHRGHIPGMDVTLLVLIILMVLTSYQNLSQVHHRHEAVAKFDKLFGHNFYSFHACILTVKEQEHYGIYQCIPTATHTTRQLLGEWVVIEIVFEYTQVVVYQNLLDLLPINPLLPLPI